MTGVTTRSHDLAPSMTPGVDDLTSLRALIVDWRRSLRAKNLAPTTIETYLRSAGNLCDFLDRMGMPSTAPTVHREHIETFIIDTRERTSAANAAKDYRQIQQFFKYLVDDGEVTVSPMANMTPPKVPEKQVPILTLDQVAALLKACPSNTFEGLRDAAMIRLLWDCGLRAMELMTMDMDSVDLQTDSATIMGKGSKVRTVPLSNNTAAAVTKYLRRGRNKHAFANRTDALWIGYKGALSDSALRQMLERRGTDAGIPNVHPHRFRHTMAHRFLAAGGQEKDLMRLAGWTSPQMIQRYGASAGAERAQAAARRLALGDAL